MTAEFGLAALWFAATLAVLQIALSVIALRRGRADVAAAMRPVAIVQGALVAVAMAALIACFLGSDMSVALVAANSHSAKPWLYKFAGAWGNHEGSMLLWVTILGLAGAAVAQFERRLPERTLIATLGAQAAIALGFYAFLLIASNPFARADPAPADGAGLNPLLQDPGLAFHPPTLYAGYVGLSVAFSFAVGALVTRDVGPVFARAMRPWVLGAWVFLTLGITAGSYWAYYELGWGGWWFWDPTENASLMPWLAATALLHSVSVLATRDGLRAWTIMLAVVAFSMSMIGTFLVRSGILTSVHAFAVDPTRGSFILALLVIYIGGALALFGARVGTVRQGNVFDPLSREGSLVVNNLLLSVILGVVLIGTFYPIVAGAMGTQLSVGAPFFDKTVGPLALILVAVMAAGPLMRWRRDEAAAVIERLQWPIAAALFAGVGVFVLGGWIGVLPTAGLGLAAGLAVASVAPQANIVVATPGLPASTLKDAISSGGDMTMFAFDLLTLDGEDLTALPTTMRKARLQAIIGDDARLHYAEHVVGSGEQLLEKMCAEGLEGVVSKRADAPYRAGRSSDWLKIKCTRRQEFVIVGWLPSTKKRGFKSLLLGVHEDGKLRYAGKVGTGFTQALMTELRAKLDTRVRKTAPVDAPRAMVRGAQWVKPDLVAEIAFTEATPDGLLRHPSFLGLRGDKPAREVVLEQTHVIADTSATPAVKITNRDRVIDPDGHVTKGDLADYYATMSAIMLPWTGHRPISLVRCPQGRAKQCFFQKHDAGSFGEAVHRVAIEEKDGSSEDYLWVNDAAGLLTCVQMGTIEFHGWGSRVDALERPDRMIFDLDPDEGLDFGDTKKAAEFVRDQLGEIGLASFPLLSGGKGVHVVVPLMPGAEWPAVRDFAERFARALAQSHPDRFVATMSKAKRKGRIFIDYLRNGRGSTAIMPYSARARAGAPVAAPVTWSELRDLDTAANWHVGDAAELTARANAPALSGWGVADQMLPDL